MNYRQVFAIKAKNERRIKEILPSITNDSGIYVFVRKDENGFKYAYIGQAVRLLERVASHLSGYQHIDISIKKWGLYDTDKNPYGWQLLFTEFCQREKLDELEQQYIKVYADKGFQLRNHTGGSQGVGKQGITDQPRKGYLQGKADGKAKAIKEIAEMFNKYLIAECKVQSIYARKALEKFNGLIKWENKDE